VVALDPRLIAEARFPSHPEESWTERHSSCGTEAKQSTDSSSPGIKKSQVSLKLVRWSWLKCTQHAVLLRVGLFSRNFTLCYPCQVFFQKHHPQTRCRYSFWSDYSNAFGSSAGEAPSGLLKRFFFRFTVSCPFLLLPLLSSEENAQMLSGILALA